MLNPGDASLIKPEYEGAFAGYHTDLFCVHNSDLYTFSLQRIYRFNYVNNKNKLCLNLPDKEGIIRFAQTYVGKLWIFTDKGLLCKIDLASFHIEKKYNLFSNYKTTDFRSFCIDNNGKIWFGTIEGIYVFTPDDETWTHYTHSRFDKFSLPNNSVWRIYADKYSNLWIGTYSGTLSYVYIGESDAFQTWTPRNGGLNYTPVSAFADAPDALWLGTEGGGMNRMDKSTGQISSFSPWNGTDFRNIKSLVTDHEQNLWISTFREGLGNYDVRQRRLVRYRHDKNDKRSLLADDIRKTILEADSGLWVAYQYQKPVVSFFSFRDRLFTHYELDKTSDHLFDIQRQGENKLWAISNEALYCLDIHTRQVEKKMPADSTYLGLFTFCLDDSGNIWIGTIGNGLVKYDVNTSEFHPMKDV